MLNFTRPYSDAYWAQRASQAGTRAVMWMNPHYNALSDRDQWRAIEKHLPARRTEVLDIGCGIGRVAPRLAAVFDRYTGFDLGPMVARARDLHPDLASRFVEGTATTFDYAVGRYDLVLSLACLSSACAAGEIPATLERIALSLAPGGRFIVVEPLHRRWPLTRRCRMSAGEFVAAAERSGLAPLEQAGIQCWPFRFMLARPQLAASPRLTAWGYAAGELALEVAPRALSDYKVLVFHRPVSR